MESNIARILAEGISAGLGAEDLAAQLTDQVDISLSRAETIARTEIINAHAEASLDAYEDFGVEGVQAQVEFATAEDEKVCPQCQDLSGQIYALDVARGMIPVHPNCRCAWIPVLSM